jgi:hypothetical protein
MSYRYSNLADDIDAWLGQASKGLRTDQLIDLFEQAQNVVWSAAHGPVSEVTLGAVLERVLLNASASLPPARHLKSGSKGICFDDFRKKAAKTHKDVMRALIRFVLLEFLAILGNITGGVLTPSLLTTLSQVSLKKPEKRS